MKRRSVIFIASGVTLGAALPLLAQAPPRVYHIGFLAARARSTPENPEVYYDAFVRGMRDLGYAEGKNLSIEWRFADAKNERLPTLSAELVAMNPELVVTHGLPPTLAMQKATNSIPIVFAAMVDPVGNRVVANLARPAGNTTGLSLMTLDVASKRVEILSAMIPGLSRLAVLVNPLNPAHPPLLQAAANAAKMIGVSVLAVEAQSTAEIERGVVGLARERVQGMIISDDNFFLGQLRQLVELTLKHRVPTMFANQQFVEAGGMVSYGPDVVDYFRRSASYVDKILRGAKPGDLPIEQATRIDLVVNNNTAKAFGLKIPLSVRVLAERVIE